MAYFIEETNTIFGKILGAFDILDKDLSYYLDHRISFIFSSKKIANLVYNDLSTIKNNENKSFVYMLNRHFRDFENDDIMYTHLHSYKTSHNYQIYLSVNNFGEGCKEYIINNKDFKIKLNIWVETEEGEVVIDEYFC